MPVMKCPRLRIDTMINPVVEILRLRSPDQSPGILVNVSRFSAADIETKLVDSKDIQ